MTRRAMPLVCYAPAPGGGHCGEVIGHARIPHVWAGCSEREPADSRDLWVRCPREGCRRWNHYRREPSHTDTRRRTSKGEYVDGVFYTHEQIARGIRAEQSAREEAA